MQSQLIGMTKREAECQFEEQTDIPSHRDMYLLLQEYGKKNSKLVERVEVLERMAKPPGEAKKKRKIIPWLNTNIAPRTTFKDYLVNLELGEELETDLFEGAKSVPKMFYEILANALARMEVPAMCTVSAKISGVHLWERESGWIRFDPEQLSPICRIVHQKLLKVLLAWCLAHTKEILKSDKISIVYTQALSRVQGFRHGPGARELTEVSNGLLGLMTKVEIGEV